MELPIHVCIKSKSTYAPNGSINHLAGDRVSNVLVEGVSGQLAKSPKQSKHKRNHSEESHHHSSHFMRIRMWFIAFVYPFSFYPKCSLSFSRSFSLPLFVDFADTIICHIDHQFIIISNAHGMHWCSTRPLFDFEHERIRQIWRFIIVAEKL